MNLLPAEQRDTTTLDRAIHVASGAYDNSGTVRAYHAQPDAERGDTLARFIAQELAAVHSPRDTYADNLGYMANALGLAIWDLQRVQDALRAKASEVERLENGGATAAD